MVKQAINICNQTNIEPFIFTFSMQGVTVCQEAPVCVAVMGKLLWCQNTYTHNPLLSSLTDFDTRSSFTSSISPQWNIQDFLEIKHWIQIYYKWDWGGGETHWDREHMSKMQRKTSCLTTLNDMCFVAHLSGEPYIIHSVNTKISKGNKISLSTVLHHFDINHS